MRSILTLIFLCTFFFITTIRAQDITRLDLALSIYDELYNNSGDPPFDFPLHYPDVPNSYSKEISTVLHLHFDDNASSFDRDRINFFPYERIERVYALKAIMEAFDQHPTNSDFQNLAWKYDDFTDINELEEKLYFSRAESVGILSNESNELRPYEYATYSEVNNWINQIAEFLTPSNSALHNKDNYEIPFNITPANAVLGQSFAQGNFTHYEKSTFNIPDVNFNLSFTHQYNSYTTLQPEEFYPIQPLGKGWSHSYNTYILEHESPDGAFTDYSLVYPDGSFQIYRRYVSSNSSGWLTNGIYDTFQVGLIDPEEDDLGVIITKKNGDNYIFLKPDGYDIFYIVGIVDRNSNKLKIHHEQAEESGKLRIEKIEAPSGKELEFRYHSNSDLLKSIEDPLNREIEFEYYDGKLSRFIDAEGHYYDYNYLADDDEEYLLGEVVLPEGNVINVEYDSKHKLSQFWLNDQDKVDVDVGDFNKNSFDNYQTTEVTVPLPNGDEITQIYTYNKNGMLSHYEDPLTDVTRSFPTSGLEVHLPESVNTNGIEAIYDYDDNGNPTHISLPYDIETNLFWNDDNTLDRIEDPRGNWTYFDYDGDGNLIEIENAIGNIVTYDYYSNGLLKEVITAEGITSEFDYFDDGGLKKVEIENVTQASFTYDDARRLLTSTRHELTTEYDYDDNDNLLYVKNPMNYYTRFDYDDNNNLVEIENARGILTTFKYDDYDRIEEITFAGLTKEYEYNDEGFLEKYTKPSGAKIDYEYDSKGRLNSTSIIADIDYDDRNNIEEIKNDEYGKLEFEYDNLNRLDKVTDEDGDKVRYDYDKNSNVIEIDYPHTTTDAVYEYDDLNRIEKVYATNINGDDILVAKYEYNKDNQIENIELGNGYIIDYDYDDLGRLEYLSHEAPSGVDIAEYVYDFDDYGNIISQDINQPIPIQLPFANGTTSYDRNDANHLTEVGGNTVEIDDDGRAVQKHNTQYTFDLADRLVAVEGVDYSYNYVYDALGFKRAATRNGETTSYSWDVRGMGNIIVEKSDSQEYLYIYGAHGLIARIESGSTDKVRYYHGDVRGSVVAMTDEDGEVTHSYSYTDFGSIAGVEEEDFNSFRYVGLYGVQYENEELQFMRARHYDPEVGRFLSEDPIWSDNLYAYSGNNPVTRIDPTGKYYDLTTDIVFFEESRQAYLDNPSLANSAVLSLDAIGLVPIIPSLGTIAKTTVKSVIKVVETGKTIYNKVGDAINATKNTNNFFDGATYSEKVIYQSSKVDDVFHSFPASVDGYAAQFGKVTTGIGSDGNTYKYLRLEGSYKGGSSSYKDGVITYIKDANGVINHRKIHPY